MIVVDTSALVAVLNKEPEHLALATAMHGADRCIISALTVYEASVVMLAKRGPDGINDLRELLASIAAEIVPFDDAEVALATNAYVQLGKGRGSKPGLNICDCAAYALAKARGLPLLFKGDDFAATDIASCL